VTARAAAVACLLTLRFREAVRQIQAWHRMCFEFVLPTLNLRLDYYSYSTYVGTTSVLFTQLISVLLLSLNLSRYYYSYSTYVGTTTRHNYVTALYGP
jgi:hypothetical protein